MKAHLYLAPYLASALTLTASTVSEGSKCCWNPWPHGALKKQTAAGTGGFGCCWCSIRVLWADSEVPTSPPVLFGDSEMSHGTIRQVELGHNFVQAPPWNLLSLSLWMEGLCTCLRTVAGQQGCVAPYIPLFHQIGSRAGSGPVLSLELGFLFPLTKNWLWARKKNSSRVAPALCWARGKNCKTARAKHPHTYRCGRYERRLKNRQ